MATRHKNASSQSDSQQTQETIQPAKGKLGIMIPGMGAVATTFVAGVEAIRKKLAKPIGSLTQIRISCLSPG
jgi:myo-inositol-1-phosphate synthase